MRATFEGTFVFNWSAATDSLLLAAVHSSSELLSALCDAKAHMDAREEKERRHQLSFSVTRDWCTESVILLPRTNALGMRCFHESKRVTSCLFFFLLLTGWLSLLERRWRERLLTPCQADTCVSLMLAKIKSSGKKFTLIAWISEHWVAVFASVIFPTSNYQQIIMLIQVFH